MSLSVLFSILKMGQGNFGHAGRPGHRGGSAPKGQSSAQMYADIKSTFKKVPIYIYQDAHDYIAHDYERVNRYLRGKITSDREIYGDEDEGMKSVSRLIRSMDEYAKAYSLPKGTPLYRSVRSSQADDLRKNLEGLKEGQKLPKIKNFQSTSLDKEYVTSDFGKKAITSSAKILLEIIPKGNKRVGLGQDSEKEIILPRDISYTYRGQRTEGENIIVQVEY